MTALHDAHALVIGIADYANIRKLPKVQGAEDLAATLVDPCSVGMTRKTSRSSATPEGSAGPGTSSPRRSSSRGSRTPTTSGSKPGRVIMASPRPDEFSCVLPGARYGLFTEYLLGGLRGCVASDDGLVRVFDLFEYLQPRVTRAHPRQHPIVKAELEENFAVALYRGGAQGFVPKVEGDCLACWFANHSLSEYACRGLEMVWLRP